MRFIATMWWLNFLSLVNESWANRTYTNSENITLQHLALRSCGRVEKGSLWVTEYIITYDGSPVNVVCIMEFRDDKIAHETLYFGDPFEPPEWRSEWVEKTD